jgi:hypothetical protein
LRQGETNGCKLILRLHPVRFLGHAGVEAAGGLEDGEQVSYAKEVADGRAHVDELKDAIGFAGGYVESDESAEAGAVHAGEAGEIENDVLLVRKNSLYVRFEERGALSDQCAAAEEREDVLISLGLYGQLHWALRRLFGLHDHQIIFHRENSGHAIGLNAREILVGIVVHDAFEAHVAIFDDDVDGRLRSETIAEESIVGKDGPENGAADAVVIGRKRKDLDVVGDARDGFELLHRVFGVGLQCGIRDGALEDDAIAVNAIFEIVEDGVARQHAKDMADFTSEVGGNAGVATLVLLGLGNGGYCSCARGES